MNKAVFSFYSRPYLNHSGFSWLSKEAHEASWKLSVGLARKWFTEVELVTDYFGKAWLIDELRLPFTSIIVDDYLDQTDLNPQIWILGKMRAYQLQTKPFVHLDNDVFLFKPLPKELLKAEIFCQHPEPINVESRYPAIYGIVEISEEVDFIPNSWKYAIETGKIKNAYNMGIYGCNNLTMNELYCQEMFDFVQKNEAIIQQKERADYWCVSIEQFTLSAICHYYSVPVSTLFPVWMVITDGFAHLVADFKRDKNLVDLMFKKLKEL